MLVKLRAYGASRISKSGEAVNRPFFPYNELKFDLVPYFGLTKYQTVAKILSCKNGFKPYLHKTDMAYSVENYFNEFARKFYHSLIHEQLKFLLFLQILQY